MHTFPSLLLQKAVGEVSRLPGIGTRTALRLVLHLLREETEQVEALANSLTELRNNVCYCRECHNICDGEVCEICGSAQRDHSLICVVENVQDVMAIEQTQMFKGVYHVLGGVISPMDGISVQDLHIDTLIQRVAAGGVREVILALSPTMEGDTTNYYIYRKLAEFNVAVSVIARGVAQNDELQYTDEVTLGRALLGRTPFAR